jgi:hypothetical protein
MCNKLGKVIPVTDANQLARTQKNTNYGHFIFYWRTNLGELRTTGYVAFCQCGKFQKWNKTKLGAEEELKKLQSRL